MAIVYSNICEGIAPENARGFFVGWPHPPSEETFLALLRKSDYRIVAKEGEQVIGFITAISDGTLSAYIPLLEVRPAYQHRGIGKELVSRMLELLKGYYMVDLSCDERLRPFYEKVGMEKASGMRIRNYERQSGVRSA